VNIETREMIDAISSNVASYVTVKTFVQALRELVVEEHQPKLLSEGRKLSETPAFPWSRQTLKAGKTVFNLVPCDNDFEKRFARLLEDANDVDRFAKLPDQFGLAVEYTDSASNLRYYYPDWAVVVPDGTHYLVETKGREDVDVAPKDRAATLWCENATMLTGIQWRYVKVPQKDFGKLEATDFADITVFAQRPLM
jgi:type III restriction enzyme